MARQMVLLSSEKLEITIIIM